MAKDKEGHGSEGYLGSKEHSGRWNVAEGKVADHPAIHRTGTAGNPSPKRTVADLIKEKETKDKMEDFNYVGNKHHY